MAYVINARRGETASAIALGAIGAFFAWHAIRLSFGTPAEPGPGFFPLVLGVMLIACAAALLWRRREVPATTMGTELGHRDVVIAYLVLLVVPLGFERLGAGATLAAFVALLLMVLDRMAWWRAVLGAVVGVSVLWYVFKHLLGVQLPRGLL
jgi:uncharacterized iron-regulated membrane protein